MGNIKIKNIFHLIKQRNKNTGEQEEHNIF